MSLPAPDYGRGFTAPVAGNWRTPRPLWDYFNAPNRDGYNAAYARLGDPVGHKGLDLGSMLTLGAEIPLLSIHPHPATVHRAGYYSTNPAAGHHVETIEHDAGAALWYMVRELHAVAGSIIVTTGETVAPGQRLALMGATGNANWRHVHLEIRVGFTKPYPGQPGTSWGIPINPLWFGILTTATLPTVAVALPVLRREASPIPARRPVLRLQTLLNAGGAGLDLDGRFGPATEAAVRAALATAPDGIVDADAWRELLT